VEVAKTFGVQLVDFDLIASLFRNKSATFHISKPSIELILQSRLLHQCSNEIQSLKPPLPNSDEYYGWVSQNENINKSPLVNSVVSRIHHHQRTHQPHFLNPFLYHSVLLFHIHIHRTLFHQIISIILPPNQQNSLTLTITELTKRRSYVHYPFGDFIGPQPHLACWE
jgi:hypothetical protein